MKTIICSSTSHWFNPIFAFSAFEPIINYNYPLTEEVTQNPFAYNFKYSVPGFKKRDLNICIQDNKLTIKGIIAKGKKWGKWGDNSRTENRIFYSAQLLNDMNTDQIKGKLRDGVLSIEIPKKKEFVNYREIPVFDHSDGLMAKQTTKNKLQNFFQELKLKISQLFKLIVH